MKFINEHKTKLIIGACAALIIALLILFGVYDDAPAPENAAMAAVSPVQKFFKNISDNAYDVTHSLGLLKDLRTRVSELEKANADYENRLSGSDELEKENDRLKRMLELRKDNPDLEMTAASVAADEPSNWFSGFTIDKGKNSGISQNNIVVSEDGFLIGKVVEAGANWASVMAITDPGFSAGVMIERSRDLAIAEGDAELRTKQQFRLANMSRAADVQEGDYVTTTGLGGIFPAGFRLGKVAGISEDSVTMTKTAYVDLCVDMSNLRDVFVITNSMDIVLDEENANMKEAREQAEREQEEIDRAERERLEKENSDKDSEDDPDSDSENDSISNSENDSESDSDSDSENGDDETDENYDEE